jgi:hypothetical protein
MSAAEFMGFLRQGGAQLWNYLMGNAEDHRRRAQRFLELAQSISEPDRRAKAIDLAIKWMVRAREASQSASPWSNNSSRYNQKT